MTNRRLGIRNAKTLTADTKYNPESFKETSNIFYGGDPGSLEAFRQSASRAFDDSFIMGGSKIGARYIQAGVDKMQGVEPMPQEEFTDLVRQNNFGEFEKEMLGSYKKFGHIMTPEVASDIIKSAKHRYLQNVILENANENNRSVSNFAGGLAGGLVDFAVPSVAQYRAFNGFTKLAQYGTVAAENAVYGGLGGALSSFKGEMEGEEQNYKENILHGAFFGALLGTGFHGAIEGIGKAYKNADAAFNFMKSPIKEYKRIKEEKIKSKFDSDVKELNDWFEKQSPEHKEKELARQKEIERKIKEAFRDKGKEQYVNDITELWKQKDIEDAKRISELTEQRKIEQANFVKQQREDRYRGRLNILEKQSKYIDATDFFKKKYNDNFTNQYRDDFKKIQSEQRQVAKLEINANSSDLGFANWMSAKSKLDKNKDLFDKKYSDYLTEQGRLETQRGDLLETKKDFSDQQRQVNIENIKRQNELNQHGAIAKEYVSNAIRDNNTKGFQLAKVLNDIENGALPTIEGLPIQNNQVKFNDNIIKSQITQYGVEVSFGGDIKELPIDLEYKIVDAKKLNINLEDKTIIDKFDPMDSALSDTLFDGMPLIYQNKIEYGDVILKHLYQSHELGGSENYLNFVRDYAKSINQDISNIEMPVLVKERTNFLSENETNKMRNLFDQKQIEYTLSKNKDISLKENARLILSGIDKHIGDRVAFSFGSESLNQTAHLLNLHPNMFNAWLKKEGYLQFFGNDVLNPEYLERRGITKEQLGDSVMLQTLFDESIKAEGNAPTAEYTYYKDAPTKKGFFVYEELELENGKIVPQTTMTKQGYYHFASLIKDGKLSNDIIKESYKDISSRIQKNKENVYKVVSRRISNPNDTQKKIFDQNLQKNQEKALAEEYSAENIQKRNASITADDKSFVDAIRTTGISIQELPTTTLMPKKFKVDGVDGIANVDVVYSVVNASDLQASHTTSYEQNPLFDQSIQPRDRDKFTSILQIEKIANNLDPVKLLYNNDLVSGSPIVGSDLMVESGNGRTIGIQKSFENNTFASKKYVLELEKMSKELGIDVSEFEQPVLVRIRKTDLTSEQRQQFAISANKAEQLQQTLSEKSASIVKYVDSDIMSLYKGGDLASGQNLPFAQKLLGKFFNKNELATLFTGNSLSKDGLNQLRSILFQKAYKDNNIDIMLRESNEDILKTLAYSLDELAPSFAKYNTFLEKGIVSTEYDFSKEFLKAVQNIYNSRKQGVSYKEILKQSDFFDTKTPEEAYITSSFFNSQTDRLLSSSAIVKKFEQLIDSGIKDTTKQLDTSQKELLKIDLLKTYLQNDEPKGFENMFDKPVRSEFDKKADNLFGKNEQMQKKIENLKDQILENNDGSMSNQDLYNMAEPKLDNAKEEFTYIDDLFNCVKNS